MDEATDVLAMDVASNAMSRRAHRPTLQDPALDREIRPRLALAVAGIDTAPSIDFVEYLVETLDSYEEEHSEDGVLDVLAGTCLLHRCPRTQSYVGQSQIAFSSREMGIVGAASEGKTAANAGRPAVGNWLQRVETESLAARGASRRHLALPECTLSDVEVLDTSHPWLGLPPLRTGIQAFYSLSIGIRSADSYEGEAMRTLYGDNDARPGQSRL